eukprot:Nk52_evm48s24 gene=Nk52_evmTU48s24
MATASGNKLSREEWKKKQELEAARKAGTVAPEVDEEGNMINPHIPQYISDAPWYLNQTQPSLKHQKSGTSRKKEGEFMPMENNWYRRGVTVDDESEGVRKGTVTKYRKGACENCGAMTHKKKDCMERPRKKGAKWTGKNIKRDEVITDVKFTWDGKRDRWNGYDPEDHREVVEEFEKVEEMKNKLKEKRLESEYSAKTVGKGGSEAGEGEEEEEFKYTEGAEVAGQKFDAKARMTVRNLRIREDTAKYLRNLDSNSAYYDPKTHSMRDNPYGTGSDPTKSTYAGDNFVRHSGDTVEFAKTQMFAWEASSKGTDLNILAEPTAVELHRKNVEEKKSAIETGEKEAILAKYGGQEYIQNAPPKELLLAQTEHYVEYDPQSGRVVKGETNNTTAKSRYAEDIHPGNHTSVWGSFWCPIDRKWGYSCCCSLVRSSYCVGGQGKIQYEQESVKKKKEKEERAKSDATAATSGTTVGNIHPSRLAQMQFSRSGESGTVVGSSSSADGRGKSLAEQHKEKMEEQEKMDRLLAKAHSKKKSAAEQTADEKALLEEALKQDKEREQRINALMRKELKRRNGSNNEVELDDRKRPYNSLRDDLNYEEPTEEELEAHKRLRQNFEDPMKDFLSRKKGDDGYDQV